MTKPISDADRAALADLESLAMKSMRSKPILHKLVSLEDRGLIRYNPFEGTAEITDAGRAAASGHG